MSKLPAAVAAIARHCGYAPGRVQHVAARLQDAGLLEKGAPGVAPRIDMTGFVTLFVALAADTTLATAAAASRTYLALRLGGLQLSAEGPASIGCADAHLLALVQSAMEHDDLNDVVIDIVSNWPEIAITHGGGVDRYVADGEDPHRWQARGHRRSTIITGRAFRAAVRQTFNGTFPE
jgi:hypothetical protein